MEIATKALLSTFASGSHVSSLKDSLIDVDVVRDYQPGDKKLDSKASLRSSRTMARVFTPDKSMTVYLVLDISASQFSKLEPAITTCLYLTYLASLAGDKVGLLTFSDHVIDQVYPSDDERDVTSVIEKVYERDLTGTTNLEHALSKVDVDNALVFLISDFCYPISDQAVMFARRIASKANNKLVSLVLMNGSEWLIEKQPFTVHFVDAESKLATNWDMNSNVNHCQTWQKNLKIRLRQARTEPVIMNVEQSNFLNSLVKYFLR